MKIIYEAVDGKQFNYREDCLEYEKKLETTKKEAQFKRIKEFYAKLSNKYFPESKPINTSKMSIGQIIMWIETDLKYLCYSIDIEELKDFTYKELPNDKEFIDNYFKWNEILTDANIRKDFASALKNCKKGTELSHPLDWAFSKRDITNLAKLHKANKYRKKIEDLLEDCNFHYECGCFIEHNYDEFLN